MVSNLLTLAHFVGLLSLQQISGDIFAFRGEIHEQSVITLQSKEDVEFCLECKRRTYIAYSLIQNNPGISVRSRLQVNASHKVPICKRPTFQVDKLRTYVSDSDKLNVKNKPIDSSLANKVWTAFSTAMLDLPYNRILEFPGQVMEYFSQPSKEDAIEFCLECSKIERLVFVNKDEANYGNCSLKDNLVAGYVSVYQASGMCLWHPRTKPSMKMVSPLMSVTIDKSSKYQNSKRLHKKFVPTVHATINHVDVTKLATQEQEGYFALEDTVTASKVYNHKENLSTMTPEAPVKKDGVLAKSKQIWMPRTLSPHHVWIWDAFKLCQGPLYKAYRPPTCDTFYPTKGFSNPNYKFVMPVLNHHYLKTDKESYNKAEKGLVWCFKFSSSKKHCRSVKFFWWLFEVFSRNRGCCKSGHPCWVSFLTSCKALANDQDRAKRSFSYGNQNFGKQCFSFMFHMLNRFGPKNICHKVGGKYQFRDEDRSSNIKYVGSKGQEYLSVNDALIKDLSCNWPATTSTKTVMKYVCLSRYIYLFEVYERCRGCLMSGKKSQRTICRHSKSAFCVFDNDENISMEIHHPLLLNHKNSYQFHLSWSYSPLDNVFDNRYSMMWWLWCFETFDRYHGCCKYGGLCFLRPKQVLIPNKINKSVDDREPVTNGYLSSRKLFGSTLRKVHTQWSQCCPNDLTKSQSCIPSFLRLSSKFSCKRTYYTLGRFCMKEAQLTTSANVRSSASNSPRDKDTSAVNSLLFEPTPRLASKSIPKWSERPSEHDNMVNISIWHWRLLFEVYGKERGCHKKGGSTWLRHSYWRAVNSQSRETGMKEDLANVSNTSKVRRSTLTERLFKVSRRRFSCTKQNMLQVILQPKIYSQRRDIKNTNKLEFHNVLTEVYEVHNKDFNAMRPFDMLSTKVGPQQVAIQDNFSGLVLRSLTRSLHQLSLQSAHVEHCCSEPSQILLSYTSRSPVEIMSHVSSLSPSKIILRLEYKVKMVGHDVGSVEAFRRMSGISLKSCNSMFYIDWCFKRLHMQGTCLFPKKKYVLTADVTDSDVWVLLLEIIYILNLIGYLVRRWSGSRPEGSTLFDGMKDHREPSDKDKVRDKDVWSRDELLPASVTADAMDGSQMLAPPEPPLLEIETIGAIVDIPRSLTAGYLCDIRFPQKEYPDLRF